MSKSKPTAWIIFSSRDGRRSYRCSDGGYSEQSEKAHLFATREEAIITRSGDFVSSGVEPIERARERDAGSPQYAPVGRCFWCHRDEDRSDPATKLTKDHVPPKGIFLKTIRSQVPMVMACRKCNEQWNLDSDYFREFLIELLAGSKHPDLPALRKLVSDTRNGRVKQGRRESLFEVKKRKLLVGTQGLLETNMKLADTQRIAGVLTRCVWAIEQYHQIKGVPADTHVYGTGLLEGRGKINAQIAIKQNGRSVAYDRFKYCSLVNQNDPNDRETLLSFYDDAIFAVRAHSASSKSPWSPIQNDHIQRMSKGYKHPF